MTQNKDEIIRELRQRVEYLEQHLSNMNRRVFGTKSEKTDQD